jgi:hypothetical protein
MRFEVTTGGNLTPDKRDLDATLARIAAGDLPLTAEPEHVTQHRQFIIREHPFALTESDACFVRHANPEASGYPFKYPPGRRGWGAITLQSDLASFDTPGFLWNGQPGRPIPGASGPPPYRGPEDVASAPPPHGGPALDGDVDRHIADGQYELWEIYNCSADIHPIHLHLVNFALIDRTSIGIKTDNAPPPAVLPSGTTVRDCLTGPPRAGDANEWGVWKDTVRANPRELLRLLVKFETTGDDAHPNETANFVWHCHLIEHEDMGMMRPMIVELPRHSFNATEATP